jgi:hypothetical protein
MKTEIEKLKADVEKLQQRIAELEKPQELTRETGIPKLKTPNYIILSNGITTNVNVIPETDYERFAIFETKEEAETERDYTLASRRVRAWAKAVNGDWKANWGNYDQKKWGIILVEGIISVSFVDYDNFFIHQICFPTQELATKFLELFRPELEILSNP